MSKSLKGGSFEREVCKLLSLWLSEGEDDDLLWRSSNSGGRATIRGRKGKQTTHVGDITETKPAGRAITRLVTTEIKRGYTKFTIADLFDKNPRMVMQEVEKWLDQVLTAQRMAGTPFWMLIQRRDQRVALIYLPAALFKELTQHLFVPALYPVVQIMTRVGKAEKVHRIVCLQLDVFLANVTADKWKEVSKRYRK